MNGYEQMNTGENNTEKNFFRAAAIYARAILFITTACLSAFGLSAAARAQTGEPTMVTMSTTLGAIEIELLADDAPLTVRNFLQYVESGYFDKLIFHRVIPGFVIQGGGFTADMRPRAGRAPIQNEADNGLGNATGTLSMARTSDPHSATSQFFINLADNAALNHTAKTPQGWGYAVFAKVTGGMDVVRAIAAQPTGNFHGHQDVPKEPVVITKVEITAGDSN